MRTIRRGVFETNSSSVHSMTMCSKSEYDKWKNGEVYYNLWRRCFVPCDEEENGVPYCKMTDDTRRDYGILTIEEYDAYIDDSYYESFYRTYTASNDEEIIAFGFFGRDG